MLAIQTGSLLIDPNRMRMTGDTYYLRSPEEMAALFPEMPDALSNTLLIAERCNVDLVKKGLSPAAIRSARRFHRRNLPAQAVRRRVCCATTVQRANDPRGTGTPGIRTGRHPPDGL